MKKRHAWLCRLGFHNWHRVMGLVFLERWCDRCQLEQWYEPEHMIWMDKP